MKNLNLSEYLRPVFQTPNDACYWYGYYNYDPLDSNHLRLLCHRATFDAKPIVQGMTVEVGYFDIIDGGWHSVGTSDSFNWQQGAMLQWLQGESKIIYNCSKDGHLISRIFDMCTGETRDLCASIYGITPDGKKSITLNMERAYWCRAYHYSSVANTTYDVDIAEDDGVYELDLESNKLKRIISINDVINMGYEPSFAKARHWLEHIMISPDGSRFCFLHRFSYDNIYNYKTRLFIADINGSHLQMIEGWKSFKWSHFGWNSSDAFSIYAYTHKDEGGNSHQEESSSILTQVSWKEDVISLIRKCYHTMIPQHYRISLNRLRKGQPNYYQYYECRDGLFTWCNDFRIKEFDIDGHPSFTHDGRYMLTDSYPDHRGMQRLVVYDRETGKALILAKIRDALTRKPGSCDLHPKLCHNDSFVTIDTAYDGRHHSIVFELQWEKIKSKIS